MEHGHGLLGNREQPFWFTGQSRRIDPVIRSEVKELASGLWPTHHFRAAAGDLSGSARQPPVHWVERLNICFQLSRFVREKRDRPSIRSEDCTRLVARSD